MTLPTPLLNGLLDIASNRPCRGLLDALDFLAAEQRTMLWQVWWQIQAERNPSASAHLRTRLEALNEASQHRLLTAPEAWSLIHGTTLHRQGENLNVLRGWIAAEELRAGLDNAKEYPSWSALGDFDGAQDVGIRIPGEVVLDWRSPTALSRLMEIPGTAIPWEHHMAEQAVERVIEGMVLLRRCSSVWAEVVDRLVHTVVLRCDPSVAEATSSTTRNALGRIVLRNPHLAEDAGVIADALLHETIHILLDHAELAAPLLPEPEGEAAIESPWSGRRLDPNTFIQACFVWYGLFTLWLAALRQSLVPVERAMGAIVRRAAGFCAAPSPQERLALYAATVHGVAPELIEVVATMSRLVLAELDDAGNGI